MQIDIVKDPRGLHTLRAAWERLEERAFLPMQQFIWTDACQSAFGNGGMPYVVTVKELGETLAIAPLRRSLRGLEWLGVHELSEPVEPLCRDTASMNALANALCQTGLPFQFYRVPKESLFVTSTERLARHRGVVLQRPDLGWPWIALNASGSGPEHHLNSGRRSDLRRATRIAEQMGSVSYEFISPTPGALPGALAEAWAVEAASWKGTAGTALVLDTGRRAFYDAYAAAAARKGQLRLAFLRIAGQPAAMQVAVEFQRRLFLLKIGYDKSFARCSPGQLLLHHVLAECAHRGMKSLEFLGTREVWTYMWTDLERSCVSLRGYPFGFQGILLLASDLARSVWPKVAA